MSTKAEVLAQLEKISDDEPLFLLRGRDVLAEATVSDWCGRAMTAEVNVPKIQDARRCAAAMRLWIPKRRPD